VVVDAVTVLNGVYFLLVTCGLVLKRPDAVVAPLT
jgi:hypothetical protein